MEQTDRLWADGPQFFYDDALFQPSTDTFLLGDFVRTRRGERICDLGAGTGLLGLLLLARQPELTVVGVEIQRAACRLTQRTAEENGLAGRLIPYEADLRRTEQLPPAGSFDAVVSNPPYFAAGSGLVSPDGSRGAARSEVLCTLADVCAAAARLLRSGGRFSLVLRPDRMAELFGLVQKYQLEPKRFRLVQYSAAAVPSLLLLECRKDGHTGLTAEPTLLLRSADGQETEESRRIYFKDR
ncbi:MAG: methyltransferase [Oscillospiraceae bacterium]|nr:methyltransferase [Oscillospiraceae bacterium]